jgi:enoyl-CoA hydratase/carnithine racemase
VALMTVSTLFAGGRIGCVLDGPIGTLSIDWPARKNALDADMWRAIPAAIGWFAGHEQARVVVLSGGGDTDFSAGADITEFDTVRKDAASARIYEAENSAAFRAVRHSPLPVIAKIRGICFGGAFGLAAACDIRIADETARFAVPAARLGLAYPSDAVIDLVRALGPQRTRAMLLGAQAISAQSALASGFLLELAQSDTLDSRVAELAGEIAAAAPLSVRASRAAISAALSGDADKLAAAAALGDVTFESADYAEGRAAFRQKRKPVFTGR